MYDNIFDLDFDEIYYDEGYYPRRLLILQNVYNGLVIVGILVESILSRINSIQVYNAKTGDLICDNYKVGSFEIQGDILELGGYFFKIPSGEHIDLPTSYRLQHYSETTGNYYFLDTEKGEIVCVALPDSQ